MIANEFKKAETFVESYGGKVYKSYHEVICAAVSYTHLDVYKRQIWLRWVFQSFINYSEQGSFSTTSTQSLKEMYFTPNGKTLLLGDGYYTDADGLYYMGTDVGLFRAVLFGGIGFQMLRYTLLGSLLFEYKRCLPVHLHRLLPVSYTHLDVYKRQ